MKQQILRGTGQESFANSRRSTELKDPYMLLEHFSLEKLPLASSNEQLAQFSKLSA